MKPCTPLLAVMIVAASLVLDGCSNRYKYVKTIEPVPAGKTDGLTQDELAIEAELGELAKAPIAAEYLGKMFKSAVVVFRENDNLSFTAKLNGDGKTWTVTRGVASGFQPDYVVPFNRQNLTNLKAIVADGKIDDEEAYRIHYVTFIPALRSFFRYEALYNEYVAKRMALPPLIHMTLKNPERIAYQGSVREISATAANVNGQWLVFEGKLGDPDLTIEVTRAKAVEFSGLLFGARPEDMKSKAQVDAQIDKVKAFLNTVTVQRKPGA